MGFFIENELRYEILLPYKQVPVLMKIIRIIIL